MRNAMPLLLAIFTLFIACGSSGGGSSKEKSPSPTQVPQATATPTPTATTESKATATPATISGDFKILNLDTYAITDVSSIDVHNRAFKIDEIALRRIEPGYFEREVIKAGSPDITQKVNISKAFYIGIFEVTQAQWKKVTGWNRSAYQGERRPVEMVSRYHIRGSGNVDLDPSSKSFLGKLRSQTSMEFELPTVAQWTFACMAGTNSDFNDGSNLGEDVEYSEDLDLLGRYRGNGPRGVNDPFNGAHALVGSYEPNAWGLYDMHGNVSEACRDAFSAVPYEVEVTDYLGILNYGNYHSVMGGSWQSRAKDCSSRVKPGPASGAWSIIGLRIVLNI